MIFFIKFERLVINLQYPQVQVSKRPNFDMKTFSLEIFPIVFLKQIKSLFLYSYPSLAKYQNIIDSTRFLLKFLDHQYCRSPFVIFILLINFFHYLTSSKWLDLFWNKFRCITLIFLAYFIFLNWKFPTALYWYIASICFNPNAAC